MRLRALCGIAAIAAFVTGVAKADAQDSDAIRKLAFLAGSWHCVVQGANAPVGDLDHLTYEFAPDWSWMLERSELRENGQSHWSVQIVPKGLWVSGILFIAFLLLGIESQRVHEAERTFALFEPLAKNIYGIFVVPAIERTFDFLLAGVPLLSAVVMLWIAFLSPRWSDRMLWGAAMTFTAFVLALNLQYCFHQPAGGEIVRTYPNVSAVVGLVAYGSWLLILRQSTFSTTIRHLLSILCVLASLTIVAYPAVFPYGRTIDILGSLALAGSLFALGIFIADRVGVKLLSRRDEA